jgi:hypothetical protein
MALCSQGRRSLSAVCWALIRSYGFLTSQPAERVAMLKVLGDLVREHLGRKSSFELLPVSSAPCVQGLTSHPAAGGLS